MPRHGTIIDQCAAPDGRQRAASFVHQKVSRRKVPIMAVAAGDGDVEHALRHTRQTQRERGNAWRNRERRGACGKAIERKNAFG